MSNAVGIHTTQPNNNNQYLPTPNDTVETVHIVGSSFLNFKFSHRLGDKEVKINTYGEYAKFLEKYGRDKDVIYTVTESVRSKDDISGWKKIRTYRPENLLTAIEILDTIRESNKNYGSLFANYDSTNISNTHFTKEILSRLENSKQV